MHKRLHGMTAEVLGAYYKNVIDRSLAAVGLLILSPLILALASVI